MKLYVCTLLALMPAAGQHDEREPVAIFFDFEQEAPQGVVEALKAELDSIMEPAGYEFDWRPLKEADGRSTFRDLVVATFKGSCSVDEGPDAPTAHGALGWTHRSGREVLPFTSLDCDRIERMVSPATARVEPAQRERVMGKALGRVLAHEMYHILGNTARHASWGVAKAVFSLRELTADELRFEAPETKLLRSRRGGGLSPVLAATAASR